MIFKFWLWQINIKIKRLDADKKIVFLANELIKAMQDGLHQVAQPDIDEGFGAIDIMIHNSGKENVSGYIYTQGCRKSMKFIPTCGTLKIIKED